MTKPVNKTTWPEANAKVCFYVCAWNAGQESAKNLTIGAPFKNANQSFIDSGLREDMHDLFNHGFLMTAQKMTVFVNWAGFVCEESEARKIRVCGVGFIG